MDIAESYTGHNFIPRSIRKLYDNLIETGLMRKDCYVLNHEKVLQQALEVLGNHDKVIYTGAKYLWNDRTWGESMGMYLILQFRTKNGNGHFRREHYDPYSPEITFSNVLSVRYYNIGI